MNVKSVLYHCSDKQTREVEFLALITVLKEPGYQVKQTAL